MPENEQQNEPPLLHRDDVPMEIAEALVSKLKEVHGPIEVKFIGDLTDEERAKLPQEMKEGYKEIYEHLVRCIVEGRCHVCGTKFPGEWPPTEGEEEWDLQGWVFYDTESEKQPPMLACPKCEEADGDGEPRPVVIPEIKDD